MAGTLVVALVIGLCRRARQVGCGYRALGSIGLICSHSAPSSSPL